MAYRRHNVHFHELELLALTLAAEEGRGAVFYETGLTLAEPRDVWGNKVLAADALAGGAFFCWLAGGWAERALAGPGVDGDGQPRVMDGRRRL